MMGVCDGHGVHGHLVSNFVKNNLPKILKDLIHSYGTDSRNNKNMNTSFK
jgi:serine/threonine protein phosphatase PrpC